jgi:hypothetical protein
MRAKQLLGSHVLVLDQPISAHQLCPTVASAADAQRRVSGEACRQVYDPAIAPSVAEVDPFEFKFDVTGH